MAYDPYNPYNAPMDPNNPYNAVFPPARRGSVATASPMMSGPGYVPPQPQQPGQQPSLTSQLNNIKTMYDIQKMFSSGGSAAPFGGDIAGGVGANGGWQGAFGGDIAASSSGGAGGVSEAAGGGFGTSGAAGGGAWSSAGSAGPVGAMIMASLIAQQQRDKTFGQGESTGGNITDMFMPSVTSNLERGNWGNLAGQATGLNPITTWIWPSKGPSEGTKVLGGGK